MCIRDRLCYCHTIQQSGPSQRQMDLMEHSIRLESVSYTHLDVYKRQLYERDIKPKLKLNTWLTKESIIKKKILPYFAKRKLSEITAKDIMRWPVSYTHLDVYKRQSRRCRCPRK